MYPFNSPMHNTRSNQMLQTNQSNSLYDYNNVLEMIKEAAAAEKKDELYYNYLIDLAPTQEEKDILESIKEDEIKHAKYFKELYKDLTGITIQPPKEDIVVEKPKSYIEGIRKAFLEELKEVEKHREIRNSISTTKYRDILFEIIIDELKHSGKYNYIHMLNLK